MMLEEFEKRTGYFPTMEEYAAIEKAYMEFSGDKDAFCKAYKKNEDGIAERIQREVNMQHINAQSEAERAQRLWSVSKSGSPTRTPTTCSRPTTKDWRANLTPST